ncbi:nucleoside-diphosphate kinase [Chloroflexota bacterium]
MSPTKADDSQKTLVLIKPDAVERGLSGNILSRLEGLGLKITAMKMLTMDGELAGRHYAVHREKSFYLSLVSFITSGPIIALVLEGPQAVETVRKTMGDTDPAKAAPGTIRGDLASDIERNLVHGSDSDENAEREIDIFFRPEELQSSRPV